MKFFGGVVATAVATGFATWLIPGISVVGGTSAIISIVAFALVLSLINASIKPILQLLGAPISILTLGLFYLIINAVLFGFAANITVALFGTGIYVNSAFSAFLGSIVVSIVSGIVNGIMGDDD
ncbi:MAG: phage holin family protein [Coriobacteriia bacterium]|nr:phage holin family protein [Coriobacteriia bacterium]